MHISSLQSVSLLDFSYSKSDNMQHGCPGNRSVSETFPGIILPLLTQTHTHTVTHTQACKKDKHEEERRDRKLFRSGSWTNIDLQLLSFLHMHKHTLTHIWKVYCCSLHLKLQILQDSKLRVFHQEILRLPAWRVWEAPWGELQLFINSE